MRQFITKPLRFGETLPAKICLSLMMFACCITSFANDPIDKNRTTASYAFTVSGKVVDDAGKGLAGATISEKGSTNSTATTADGSFTINLQGNAAVLVVSYVGYTIKEIPVTTASSSLTIQLSSVSNSLEDVIVVGYGTQRKLTSTSAVSSVKGGELAKVPAANITNSLAGRATGVITRANGGRPGADNATITIRGAATTGATGALIVV